MLEGLSRSTPAPPREDPTAAPLARAAAAVARLDQALGQHPLAPALLYRARLEAVRHAAAVDGQLIDPWHLAAVLEGLRLRMDPHVSIMERGAVFDAARHALEQYQWLVRPDFDQEGEVQAAEKFLAAAPGATPLLAGGRGFHAWIERGGGRLAGRAALARYWRSQQLLRSPYPLIAAAALRAEAAWEPRAWMQVFLDSLADEAEEGLQLLMTLERAWFAARARAAGRRSTSRAALAIDVMAAAPLVSATSLARALGMAVKNATAMLEGFRGEGIAVEVSHRSKRRLYGLAALAPLREGVAPPRRPEPGRGRGRPPLPRDEEAEFGPPPPLAPLNPIQRHQFDYSGLEAAMALVDEAMRRTRRTIAQTKRGQTDPRVELPSGEP